MGGPRSARHMSARLGCHALVVAVGSLVAGSLGRPACSLLGVVSSQALQDLFHAGQSGVEGDLDQPPPDLLAAVLVIGQVEDRVGEQVGSPGLAGARDRSQARSVEDVKDRPSGHDVHDAGMARISVPVRLASAAVTTLPVSVASIASMSPPTCSSGTIQCGGSARTAFCPRCCRAISMTALRRTTASASNLRCGMAVPTGNLKPDQRLGRPAPAATPTGPEPGGRSARSPRSWRTPATPAVRCGTGSGPTASWSTPPMSLSGTRACSGGTCPTGGSYPTVPRTRRWSGRTTSSPRRASTQPADLSRTMSRCCAATC